MKGGGGVEWLEHHFFSRRYEGGGGVVEWLEHHFFSQRYDPAGAQTMDLPARGGRLIHEARGVVT